ncbi:MAG: dihydroorotase [Candidatus Cloacimonetes bacterium]|nr:dihydroorotase [Candidatus Cloacimonadota bacterium]
MILIKNALVSAGNKNETKLVNILFNEKIKQISEDSISANVTETIDLQGKLLIPGCIDAHVHFNDPGFTHHEDFTSGTMAAAYGGITTVIDMPCTSIPPVTNKKNLYSKLDVIEKKAVVDFALWGGIRSNDFPLSEEMILELWQEGIVGFKLYTISGMDTFAAVSYDDIENIFRTFPDLLYAFHAEDAEIIKNALADFSSEELTKSETYVYTRPVAAEYTAVKKILKIAKNNHVHFVHISSRKAAELIWKAKKKMDITFETCPHYLQFTADDFPELKGRLKTTPPVKFKEDKQFLRSCLKNGSVDFITTDHAGCDWKTEKELDDFSKIYSGIPAIELMIPYLFSEFYLKEKVPLTTMIKLTSENQAKRYGLFPNKGSLKMGTDADFTVIDLNKKITIDEKKLHSLGKYSPFDGNTFNCSVNKTIVRGKVVFNSQHGLLQKPGWGKFVRRT